MAPSPPIPGAAGIRQDDPGMPVPVALHHVVQGPARATPLVFSHSLGATLAMWDPQAAALAGVYRVVHYDLRGHGLSPVPPGPYQMADLGADLIALLDRLDIERAHLVGLSLGAMVSLWVAAYHGNRGNRLVVCSTSAALGPPQGWADRAAQVRAGGTAIIADEVVARWFTPIRASRENLWKTWTVLVFESVLVCEPVFEFEFEWVERQAVSGSRCAARGEPTAGLGPQADHAAHTVG
jgi:pimeloyl-ACP methyl ester carboxylesterase